MSVSHFSNFGSLKSTETDFLTQSRGDLGDFSNFGSLKSTETRHLRDYDYDTDGFQQFRLVEEH